MNQNNMHPSWLGSSCTTPELSTTVLYQWNNNFSVIKYMQVSVHYFNGFMPVVFVSDSMQLSNIYDIYI